MRKPDFCLRENKGADQLRSNCEADQRLCFRYTDSTLSLLIKSEISSFYAASEKQCIFSMFIVKKNIRMGITVFNFFIWGGISSDIRSEIMFSDRISDDIPPQTKNSNTSIP